MTWEEAVALGCTLPGMEVSASYGTPALKTRGRLVTRLLEDGASLVLLDVPSGEREMLIAVAPEIDHLTPHDRPYDAVLARLGVIDARRLMPFLERRWRRLAARRLLSPRRLPGTGA